MIRKKEKKQCNNKERNKSRVKDNTVKDKQEEVNIKFITPGILNNFYNEEEEEDEYKWKKGENKSGM